MNTVVTSKEAILKVCRDIVLEKGLPALNMRSVAESCHVALGSLYNYFPSKDDLLIATIESVWQDIFHTDHICRAEPGFPEYVAGIIESVRRGADAYPNFFTAHSLSLASEGKNRARDTMEHYFAHMRRGMTEALRADAAVRPDAFSGAFPESAFIDFVLSNILMLLIRQTYDCGVLLETVRRTIYETRSG